jgi:hypothetical protein
LISNDYQNQGFAVCPVYGASEIEKIKSFAVEWIFKTIESAAGSTVSRDLPIDGYHQWIRKFGADHPGYSHGEAFRAPSRHQVPPQEIRDILINQKLTDALKSLGISKFSLWDEGLGWLAYRFVRPDHGDGYPLSRKEWGPAKKVISVYVPVVGYSANETISFVPGSHLKEYPHFLPKETKFRHDEFRLSPEVTALEQLRPALRPGEVILFHPKTLHTEEITGGNTTRLSLEFRILPNE